MSKHFFQHSYDFYQDVRKDCHNSGFDKDISSIALYVFATSLVTAGCFSVAFVWDLVENLCNAFAENPKVEETEMSPVV